MVLRVAAGGLTDFNYFQLVCKHDKKSVNYEVKMSQFIIQEAEDIDMDHEEEEDKEESSNFIDDETNFLDQEPSNYGSILPSKTKKKEKTTNVTLSYEEAIKINRHLHEKLMGPDPENFVNEFVPKELDEFKIWEKELLSLKIP